MGHRAKPSHEPCAYVGKGGLKLAFALAEFKLAVDDLVASDFGSHQGGFVDCLLQHHVAKVYAVDTCYGTLAWRLRQNPQVVVCERTNALYWKAPEKLDLITIDVGWTKQEYIIPAALKNLKPSGVILSLLKPQYEAGLSQTKEGVLAEPQLQEILQPILSWLEPKFQKTAYQFSPYLGSGGNREVWLCLQKPYPAS